jgi:hypothetical protein
MKIFLSYASEDRSTAEAIAFSLRDRGHNVFLDRDGLQVGEGFDKSIEQAVNTSSQLQNSPVTIGIAAVHDSP